MNRQDLQTYSARWRLVKQLEDEELEKAPLELMIQQTLSVWEMARALGFQNSPETPDLTWQTLQRKWLEANG